METALIKIPEGNYENDDAVEKVIRYIMRLGDQSLIGGYGVFPLNENDVIQQFYAVKEIYNQMGRKQIFHVIISVDKTFYFKEKDLKKLGDLMSGYFLGRQVVFAVHNDKKQMHIHMAVNTVSYLNGSYRAFWNLDDMNQYAKKCVNSLAEEVWFGKKNIGI